MSRPPSIFSTPRVHEFAAVPPQQTATEVDQARLQLAQAMRLIRELSPEGRREIALMMPAFLEEINELQRDLEVTL